MRGDRRVTLSKKIFLLPQISLYSLPVTLTSMLIHTHNFSTVRTLSPLVVFSSPLFAHRARGSEYPEVKARRETRGVNIIVEMVWGCWKLAARSRQDSTPKGKFCFRQLADNVIALVMKMCRKVQD